MLYYDTMLHTAFHMTSEGVEMDHTTRAFKIEVKMPTGVGYHGPWLCRSAGDT